METKKKEKKERNGYIKSQSYDFGNSIAKQLKSVYSEIQVRIRV